MFQSPPSRRAGSLVGAFAAVFVAAAAVVSSTASLHAQAQMPDPKQISGVPLPVSDVPAGTLTLLVVRGSFDQPIAGQDVTFTVDGKPRVLKTDASGRAQVTGLKAGTHLKAVTTVTGERLESQDVTIADSGIRMVLVATDPNAAKRAEEDRRLAAGPAIKGSVVFGPETRVVGALDEDQLEVFYLIDIVNTARSPVDIGGPISINLPPDAQGAALADGSSKQAAVSGSHLTVTGPFPPGTTSVQVGFELPASGGTVHIEQVWPEPLPQVTVMMQQAGDIDIRSPQIATKKLVSDQGPTVLAGVGPALPAGQPLVLDITGLPHHPRWPRYLALGLATAIMAIGIWAAATPTPRRREA